MSKQTLNPARGETMEVGYRLGFPADVTLNVYDPDWHRVRTMTRPGQQPGPGSFSWDGKDDAGRILPDEAYFFTLLARGRDGETAVYDPTSFSGGNERDITSATVDSVKRTISYRLPFPARVLIRLGLEGGPLLRTLVDWQPRPAGMVTEYWDGKDEDGLISLWDEKKFKMIITCYQLPENSVILYGNKNMGYVEYVRMAGDLPKKPDRGSLEEVSPHYRMSRITDRSPRVKLSFSPMEGRVDDGAIVLRDRTIVNVDLDEESRKLFRDQQFEIVFFLDGRFYAEDEVGYTPFNWVWDLYDVPEGEHVLTVNLSSFSDQIGVKSHRIVVRK
ncbi:FlgD immunoglobulin-like domain containing protein [Deferrisoma sp.]